MNYQKINLNTKNITAMNDDQLFYYCVEEIKSYELHDIDGLYRTEYNSIVVKNFLGEEEAIECLTFLNNLNRQKYKYTIRKIIINL